MPIDARESSACLNCGADLDARFCGSCGQDSREPPDDVPGLISLLGTSVLGLESRAIRSFITLLIHPGRLTRAFLDGQRIRYSSPLQLYLWCTAAFFLVQTFMPMVRLDVATGQILSDLSVISMGTSLSPETLQSLSDSGTSMAVFAERFDAAVVAYFPVLLVALVGLTAFLMRIQFRNERSLTHALFALHWASFYFVLESGRQLLPRSGPLGQPLSIVSTLLAGVYLYAAMRVVYRRSRAGMVIRAFVTMTFFSLLLGAWLWSTTAIAARLA